MLKTHLLILCLILSLVSLAQEYEYDYNFFTNSPMAGDYFFSKAASGGGSTIKNSDGKLPVSETIFHTPGNAIELQYQNASAGNWQASVYYQEKRGMDHFKKATVLAFWIFTPSSTIGNELPVVQLMAKDSSISSPFALTAIKANEWQQVMLPLSSFKNFDTRNVGNCIAVVFSQSQKIAGSEQTIFIDDIEFLPSASSTPVSSKPEITSAKGYAMHIDLTWLVIKDKNVHLVKIYRSENGNDYKAVGVQQSYINRYADFTGETGKNYHYKISFLNDSFEETELSALVSAATKPMTDDEMLTMVQEASFRYYWEGAETNSGMAKENIPGRQNMIASGASGFGIMALIVGTERGFISRNESVARFVKIVGFLEKAETFHGAYPHFIDGPSGKVEPFSATGIMAPILSKLPF